MTEKVLIKKFHMKDVEQNVAYCSRRPSFPSGQNGYCCSLSKNRDEDKLLSFAKAPDNNDEWRLFSLFRYALWRHCLRPFFRSPQPPLSLSLSLLFILHLSHHPPYGVKQPLNKHHQFSLRSSLFIAPLFFYSPKHSTLHLHSLLFCIIMTII